MRRLATVTTVGALALATAVFGAGPASAAETATVYVVHGIPDLPVDVYVNGALTLDDFAPETVTAGLDLPAGSYDVAVTAADAADASSPLLTATADVVAGTSVSLVAHLKEDGSPTITPFANDVSSIAAGQTRIVVRHTAAAPAVDVRAGGTVVLAGVTNPNQGVLNIPAGSVEADVVLAGTDTVAIGPATLDLAGGCRDVRARRRQRRGRHAGPGVVHRHRPALRPGWRPGRWRPRREPVVDRRARRHADRGPRCRGRRRPPPDRRTGELTVPDPGRQSVRPAGMSRRQAVTCLAAGLALLVAAPVARAWLTPDPAGQTVVDLNADAAAALAVPAVGPAPSAAVPAPTAARAGSVLGTDALPAAPPGDTAPGSTTGPAAPDVPAAQPAPAALDEAPDPGPPIRLRLPTLGIDSPVIPVGVTAAGDLEIPGDVDDIGWYRFGPLPGSTGGSAVLTGHVDNAQQGAGPFARLGELAEGDTVVVVDDTGADHAYTVLAREEWSKSEVPLDRIFDRGGSARLVLITCGGRFDAAAGHYEDNIAITAVPVATSAG